MNAMTMTNTRKRKPDFARRVIWGAFALVLSVAPIIFDQGASLSLLSQMGTLMIFALSYNMLLGQGGMLSFGHAVYSGLGAYCAIHAINMASGGMIWMPLALIPLVGGLAGMFFGFLFGYVSTKKSGLTFAMITLGIAELVFACALMFPPFFGGEGGISANRVYGEPFLGITYGPQIQVYYLIAFWLFICTVGMYAFPHTPLGRIMNAVRDNAERAEFIGYDAQRVRYLTLIVSAFFAGIAGALTAINFEIATAEAVSAHRSASVLLFTFIGGVGYFFGPIIGAIAGVFLTVMLSGFTSAWQLYLGLLFILIVMYAPGGIAGIIMLNLRVAKHGRFGRILPGLIAVCVAGLLLLLGVVMAVEMLYHLTLESVNGTTRKLFGVTVDTAAAMPWVCMLMLLTAGFLALLKSKRIFRHVWDEVNSEIDAEICRAAS